MLSLTDFNISEILQSHVFENIAQTAGVCKQALDSVSHITPIVLSGMATILAVFLLNKTIPKDYHKLWRLPAIIISATCVLFLPSIIIDKTAYLHIWLSLLLALAYILIAPFILRAIIINRSKVFSPTSIWLLSIAKIILFTLATGVLISASYIIIIGADHKSHLIPSLENIALLTSLLSRLHMWLFLNLTVYIVWLWQRKLPKSAFFQKVDKIPYIIFSPLLAISSSLPLFAPFLSNLPPTLDTVALVVFIGATSLIVVNPLSFLLISVSRSILLKMFPQDLLKLFPLEVIMRFFCATSVCIIAARITSLYIIFSSQFSGALQSIESLLMRLIITTTIFSCTRWVTKRIRAYFKKNSSSIKRTDRNRHFLSIAMLVQNILPSLINVIGMCVGLFTLGVDLIYSIFAIAAVFAILFFTGRHIIDSVWQGFLHTTVSGHIAIGDLITVHTPMKTIIGCIESLTLYNLTIRDRGTFELHIIPFSFLSSFSHMEKSLLRIVLPVKVGYHVPWDTFHKAAFSALQNLYSDPNFKDTCLGAHTIDVDDMHDFYYLARISFDADIDLGNRFILKRAALTKLLSTLNESQIDITPQYNVPPNLKP